MSSQHASDELQVVVFAVGGNEFGVPISVVREILAVSKLVSLPNMPPSMIGITNVRGTILPVVDLRTRFGMDSAPLFESSSNQRTLLVELGGSLVGYLVDSVSEVLQVAKRSLETVDSIPGINRCLVHSICKLEDRLIPIINAAAIMTGQEARQLKEVAQETAVLPKD